ncbi:hypothetical protein [Paenibacillus ehimensis]|uniref:Zinc ribbon domain-containing protein n=1 Tax=Paenibacillus ehimensis TaxID=79264 RepID=A0ABT8VER9_9BACL|nr:hypothetical protein [Paenibacillus ehimensis]MDO3679481.1 hypothetical protein [Paenibacillus ehimensis]MEC0207480.1 hypothetical protein [Paenibacillus ehimensis]
MTARCPHCSGVHPLDASICPHCGAEAKTQDRLLDALTYWDGTAAASRLYPSLIALLIVVAAGGAAAWLHVPALFWTGVVIAFLYRLFTMKI